MNRTSLFVVGLLLFLPVGCANRQRANRIVFVAATPPLASPASPEAAGVLTLAEPQLQETEEGPEPPPPEPEEKPRTRPRARLAPADSATEPQVEVEPEPAPSAEVPLLEPLGGPGEQAQQQQVQQLQDQVRGRITRQENARLSADDHRMLDDARTFLSQSERALATRDFPRARTLARKASMLLAVIEQQ